MGAEAHEWLLSGGQAGLPPLHPIRHSQGWGRGPDTGEQ